MNKDLFYAVIVSLMFPLAAIGAMEIRNHLVAGPLREWVVDEERLTEAVDLLSLQLSQRSQIDRLPPELASKSLKRN